MGALFEGWRELFTGLAIDALPWEWKKYPVIRIDLNAGRYTEGVKHLDARLSSALFNVALMAGLEPRGEMVEEQFGNFIMDMWRQSGERVVVLVDEYDKLLLSTIDNPALYEEIRNTLKGFYAENSGMEREAYLTRLKRFYNGYRFSESPLTMYNSFGILHHFNRLGKFLPYWFESGTPTFLIRLIAK
jgi:hypothetical protein